MYLETENLKALIAGHDLTAYQRALAKTEYQRLISTVKEMEQYLEHNFGNDFITDVSKGTYNDDELRHIAVNYAIYCLNGYEGSFTDWFNRISKDWRKIANRKHTTIF